MIVEIAEVEVRPGQESGFERTIADTRELLALAEGCGGVRLMRGVEHPSRYRLLINWDSLDHHARFRATAEFGTWREQVGPFFAGPPKVEHAVDVLER